MIKNYGLLFGRFTEDAFLLKNDEEIRQLISPVRVHQCPECKTENIPLEKLPGDDLIIIAQREPKYCQHCGARL